MASFKKRFKYGLTSILTRVLLYPSHGNARLTKAFIGWLGKNFLGHPLGTSLANDPPKFSRISVGEGRGAIILGVQPQKSAGKNEAEQLKIVYGDHWHISRVMENFERQGRGLWGRQVAVSKEEWQRVAPGTVVSDRVNLEDFTGIQPKDWQDIVQECQDWDEALIKGTNVLVHCKAGVGRSHFLSMAYHVLHQDKTYLEALKIDRDARPQVDGGPRVGKFFGKGDKLFKKMPAMVGIVLSQNNFTEAQRTVNGAVLSQQKFADYVSKHMANPKTKMGLSDIIRSDKSLSKLEKAVASAQLYRISNCLTKRSAGDLGSRANQFLQLKAVTVMKDIKTIASRIEQMIGSDDIARQYPDADKGALVDQVLQDLLHEPLRSPKNLVDSDIEDKLLLQLVHNSANTLQAQHSQTFAYQACKNMMLQTVRQIANKHVTPAQAAMRAVGRKAIPKWYRSPRAWLACRQARKFLRRQLVDLAMLEFPGRYRDALSLSVGAAGCPGQNEAIQNQFRDKLWELYGKGSGKCLLVKFSARYPGAHLREPIRQMRQGKVQAVLPVASKPPLVRKKKVSYRPMVSRGCRRLGGRPRPQKGASPASSGSPRPW